MNRREFLKLTGMGVLAMLLVFSGLVYGWSSLDAAWQREYVSEGDYVRMSQEIVQQSLLADAPCTDEACPTREGKVVNP